MACEGCGLVTARSQKAVSKMINTKATNIGKIIVLDSAGPFQMTITGSRYWHKVDDDLTSRGWINFKVKKSVLIFYMTSFVTSFVENKKVLGHPVKYMRCDGARENEEP